MAGLSTLNNRRMHRCRQVATLNHSNLCRVSTSPYPRQTGCNTSNHSTSSKGCTSSLCSSMGSISKYCRSSKALYKRSKCCPSNNIGSSSSSSRSSKATFRRSK